MRKRSEPSHRQGESGVVYILPGGRRRSLSSGERAGVRGTETTEDPPAHFSTAASRSSAFAVVTPLGSGPLPSPSPRPSPPGRGRTWEHAWIDSTHQTLVPSLDVPRAHRAGRPHALPFFQSGRGCTLSPRERAGVRGNATFPIQAFYPLRESSSFAALWILCPTP
jgi:hypothetical protein